jgi:hypothetical protein
VFRGRLAERVDEPRQRRLIYGCSVRQPEEMTIVMTHPNRADYATDEDYFAALDEYFATTLYITDLYADAPAAA